MGVNRGLGRREEGTPGLRNASFTFSRISGYAIRLQSKYSAHSAHYSGMIFINRERIALFESQFYF